MHFACERSATCSTDCLQNVPDGRHLGPDPERPAAALASRASLVVLPKPWPGSTKVLRTVSHYQLKIESDGFCEQRFI